MNDSTGQHDKRREAMALVLALAGFNDHDIQRATGLSAENVLALRAEAAKAVAQAYTGRVGPS